MDYTQSPFLGGVDYSSEVADLRDNINELAADISQINITLTDDIRNVNERLNVYQNNIRQNVYTNKLEANVAEINNAYIDDIYTINVKTNVLDVNTLNVASINNTILVNPHIENIDAVNGQILNAEVINSVIVNGSGSFNSLNVNTVNIDSGSIKRVNIDNSTLTNVVISGFDLNNPRYLSANNADFNVANFNNIYGVNADFDYIERVNTDDVRTTNIIVNGDARLHYLNANNALIRNIVNTNIFNATLSNIKIKNDLDLSGRLTLNGVYANFINVLDLNANTISVQELTDVNLIHANNVSSDWGYIQNLAAHNLTLDVSEEPRETPYVLGYDANGNIFPAIAQGGGGGGSVVLPADADYIYTDGQGLPLKGLVATDLNDSSALVKAGLVAPIAEQVDTLTNQLNDVAELLSVLNEFKPNETVDYFNSISPLDYRTITAFESGKTVLKNKDDYTVVSDGILGFTGLRVENNVLHFDSTLNNFYYNKDLSFMFNGCTNFDGTGFDIIPEGTVNTAYMFADTVIKKPYKLPTSVINSSNMYKNVVFEVIEGEDVDNIVDVSFKVNDSFDLNVINSNITLYNESGNISNANVSVVNSTITLSNNANSYLGLAVNNSDFYFENSSLNTKGSIYNSNVTLNGNFFGAYGSQISLIDCEINAVNIEGWSYSRLYINGGNVYIGNNTPVNGMFLYSNSYIVHPNIIYPYTKTNWAGLYKYASYVNNAFLNEILPGATNVDEMFYYFGNKNVINISNVLGVLNKNIKSLYGFQTGLNAVYNSLADLRAVFPYVTNIGDSNLVTPYSTMSETDFTGFTDVSGLRAKTPEGVTTFNVPMLTTLNMVFSSLNNVNIVISNNCTVAPGIYNRTYNTYLTGDLSGIKNGYYLYSGANQFFGYPENLESAQYMYVNSIFNEIGEPIPNGLTNIVHMFEKSKITSVPGVMNLSNCMNAQYMFNGCSNLTSVDFNFLKTLNPGADISYMFYGCNNLVLTDLNIFTYIPEDVNAINWFGGKFNTDVNTNNESIISLISGLNVDGNINIETSINNLTLIVTNMNKSLSVNASPNAPSYYYSLSSYENSNIKISANSQQSGTVMLYSPFYNSSFEVNGGNVYFTGGGMSTAGNSRFVFTNVDNAILNGNTRYYGPYLELYNCNIELNNVNFLNTSGLGGTSNVYLNKMPARGFNIFNIIVDGPADIDVLDIYSKMNNVSFVDNRLSINTINNMLFISSPLSSLTDIYVNNIGASGFIQGYTVNVIIHIPTNADLATGLNNGTYGYFPSENIIQY